MKYRVLDLPTRNALYNTALDGFLLEKAGQGQFTLAFTKWRPSVLIGNSESLALDVDQEICREKGVSIMRRFSGGQAVYLDENYIVFTVAGPRDCFPRSLTELRQQLCEACAKALKNFGVPATFSKPDNLVVNSPRIRTLGNSGQVIKRDCVAVGASIRYNLTDESLREMLAVLKTNGRELKEFFEPAKKALASLREFTSAGFDQIKEALTKELAAAYGCEGYYPDDLSLDESRRIEGVESSLASEIRLGDKPTYVSRGVCYFYLDGNCIVPEIAKLLPWSKPSTLADSTIV